MGNGKLFLNKNMFFKFFVPNPVIKLPVFVRSIAYYNVDNIGY